MDASPFSRLSAELRNRIYELALIEPYGIVLTMEARRNTLATSPSIGVHDLKKVNLHNPRPSTALLRVCRQIRDETRSMYVSVNKLVINPWVNIVYHLGWPVSQLTLMEWVDMVGPEQVKQLRTVDVILGAVVYKKKMKALWDGLLQLRHVLHRDAHIDIILWTFYFSARGYHHLTDPVALPFGNPGQSKERIREQGRQLCPEVRVFALSALQRMENLMDSMPIEL
ncbi:hypothetical protein LTR08_001456 [Meristemomyces frigidus]|nr:hypothetical protein LTR08_001456 [Meristemomyces frigidus]